MKNYKKDFKEGVDHKEAASSLLLYYSERRMDNTKYLWYNDTNLKETEGIGIK